MLFLNAEILAVLGFTLNKKKRAKPLDINIYVDITIVKYIITRNT